VVEKIWNFKVSGYFVGLTVKLGIIDFGVIFVRKKTLTRSTGHGPHPASVHGGPRRCACRSTARMRYGSPVVAARGGGGRGGRGDAEGALTGDGRR
jgi:hypothetical protein